MVFLFTIFLRRRMMALEARIKVQEGILQSTREELRKKDFDLLDAKKYLGIAILERLERESTKQVQRLVTALAVLPCSGPDADAVGQAMARWESAGDQASKAKNLFLEQCAKSQAILYEGYGSDSFQKLIIPIIEEPAGQCPLDKIALNLLSERENAESNQAKVHPGPSYERFPPYRVRPGNGVGGSYTGPSYTSYRPSSYHQSPTHVSAPMPHVSHGARPRETPPATNGETSEVLQSWPSTSSIPNSTVSSSPGNAAALTCSKKLFTELKKAYPSRSEDELWYAVVSVRRNNKNSLSGLPIKRIVALAGNVLDWWPEPSEGSMGLDKFIGWAADAANPSEESSRGAQKSVWSSATLSPKSEAEKDDCCICLQTMSSPKTELNCTHTFHTECIRKWLSKESVCPICRKFTRMADEFPSLK
ncbi:hypothetical protein J437_LFUL012382 [Ladona fulva]|uniref:RING-type domain-containing protein n=1 Tax=Ladona fulva TaxID=123851 RepID=A0A8K0KEE1_LADFU|nr:hypothetical protein J437_LFUL012382 [Ladona fulva]